MAPLQPKPAVFVYPPAALLLAIVDVVGIGRHRDAPGKGRMGGRGVQEVAADVGHVSIERFALARGPSAPSPPSAPLATRVRCRRGLAVTARPICCCTRRRGGAGPGLLREELGDEGLLGRIAGGRRQDRGRLSQNFFAENAGDDFADVVKIVRLGGRRRETRNKKEEKIYDK